MAKLSEMTTASINEHTMQTNASLHQLTMNTNQLHHQQQDIINQMAMMTMNHGTPAPATQQNLHMPPHQSTSPRHYHNIPWGTTSHTHNLEDGAPWEDAEEDMDAEEELAAVADDPVVDADVATQAYQCHMSEATN